MQRSLRTRWPLGLEPALLAAAADHPEAMVGIPEQVPVVPLRNALLWPGHVAALDSTRVASQVAVEQALAADRLLALFAQIDATQDAPKENDLHRVGALGRIATTIREGSELWVVVSGLSWVRLVSWEAAAAFNTGRIEPFIVHGEGGEELVPWEEILRANARKFAATLPDSEPALARVSRMSALELADASVLGSSPDFENEARYVSESSLLARLKLASGLTRT
jgi:ATP-dependent Lon protease